jgi:hypothetical protein
MSNKDLLKQAIAEAKTIREAAIANAKEALEESLTPHLKDMLAAKLQEMEEADEMEEIVNEEDVMNDPKGESAHGNVAEAEEAEEEAEEKEEAEEEGNEEGEEEEVEIEDMSIDDLKDLIRDIVSQEVGHDESEEELPGEEAPEGEEDMVSMDGDSEEIDINELLAELAEEDEIDEYGNSAMREPSDSAAAGAAELEKMVKALAAKTGKSYDAISNFLYGGKKMTSAEFEEGVQTELNEALETVKVLRTQLQEVNLLNAKLLYVNKVFKSNNLSEGQKVNVIAAFDKAETVKEVKLVFETVSRNVVTKPAAIKEHRSFASKATGNAKTTAPKEILSEVSEQVSRWQKLAGIIK